MNALYRSLKTSLEGLPAEEGLRVVSEQGLNARFSSAFGEEDQVITHLIAVHKLPITIFTLDTGRLFQETYDLMDLTRTKYRIPLEVHFPDSGDVEDLVNKKGLNSFYESVENRKECCHIRKVKPLRRALKGTQVWITGLRAQQSTNRQQFETVQWDEDLGMVKYNPLLSWTYEQMQTFIDTHRIPVSPLHKKGFASIGCAPCTRAIMQGEDIRAGRWWWENSKKECGLHEAKVIAK